MATAYIAEYADVDIAPTEPRVTQQTVATSGASAQSAAFNANTCVIAISTPAAQAVACRFALSPTAVVTDLRLPANGIFFFRVSPGQKVALIDVT